jgi:hypothetical protein
MRFPLVTTKGQAEKLSSQRSCGPCSACCVLPRIPDLRKLGYVPCDKLSQNQAENGCCSIYADRPGVCRDYQCLWRAGMIDGNEQRRPDNLELMFSLETVGGRIAIEGWELWEGAFRDHPGRGVIDALAERTPLYLRYYGVPCSLGYQGPSSLLRGAVLSRNPGEDPPALARWLEDAMATLGLAHPGTPDVEETLESLRRGEAIYPQYDRRGRLLRLPPAP